MVEKSPVLPEAELISALYDGCLSESEARHVIDLIMSDENAAKLWQDVCRVSDMVKGQHALGAQRPTDLHRQVIARLSAEVEEVCLSSKRSFSYCLWFKHFLSYLQSSCWRRTAVGVTCCSILFLSVLSVWSPSGIFFWRSDRMDLYAVLPIDSSANSVSIKQGLADSVENELARHYLQKHQEAVLSGL